MTDIDSSSDFTRPLSVERFDEDRGKARAKGFAIVDSDERTLTLDLDGAEALLQYERYFPKAAELFGLEEAERWTSKSGEGHLHVVLRVVEEGRTMSVRMRIALQAILGSDPVRELLALKRYENGVAEPSQLFKPFEAQHPEVFGS